MSVTRPPYGRKGYLPDVVTMMCDPTDRALTVRSLQIPYTTPHSQAEGQMSTTLKLILKD